MPQKYKNCPNARNARKFELHMAGIYLHIPFCRQACYYCDFHFSTNSEIKGALVSAMGEEISLQRNYLGGDSLRTIYFGGGTPSLLDPKELESLLEAIFKTHRVVEGAEITLECNPDDLTRTKLADFRALGINRLSIGIQSFDNDVLHYLNRVHEATTAIRSVDDARKAGFENISIDLIYAIPGMSSESWRENLTQAVGLQTQHISAYTLTIEEKTTFGNWLSKGKLKPVDEALAAEQQELLMDILPKAGYMQYEISNFAKPDFESRHNQGYWKGDKYLGIGPSAHSFDKTSRQHNISNNHLYVRSIREHRIPYETEVLKRSDQINEYILTALRTDRGCDLDALKQNFNYDLLGRHAAYIRELESHNLVSLQHSRLTLTHAGRLLADKISSDLFLLE